MDFLKSLENIRGDFLTDINLFITKLGEEVFLMAILCLVFWCINKKLGYGLAFSFLISGIIVNVLKIVFKIPRPFLRYKELTPVKDALGHATGYSFPSGHSQASSSIFSYLSIYFAKRGYALSLFLLGIPFIVAFSRMYLGVHTAYDVSIGFFIAFVISLILNHLWDSYSLDKSHYRRIYIIFTIISFSVIIFAAYQNIYEDVSFKNASDLIKVGASSFGFINGWYLEVTKINFLEKGVSLPWQIIKYICGLFSLIILKFSSEFIFDNLFGETSILSVTIPYFLMTLYIVGIYPIIIKKFFTSPYIYQK